MEKFRIRELTYIIFFQITLIFILIFFSLTIPDLNSEIVCRLNVPCPPDFSQAWDECEFYCYVRGGCRKIWVKESKCIANCVCEAEVDGYCKDGFVWSYTVSSLDLISCSYLPPKDSYQNRVY
jgi:hypothetical protein